LCELNPRAKIGLRFSSVILHFLASSTNAAVKIASGTRLRLHQNGLAKKLSWH